jgi:hypothetical protein
VRLRRVPRAARTPAVLAAGVVTLGLLVAALAGCQADTPGSAPSASSTGSGGSTGTGSPSSSPSPSPSPTSTPNADGSVMSPPLPPQSRFDAQPLQPGQRPPQFVVVGFDGSGDVDQLRAWADITQRVGGHATYFLSGVFLVPNSARDRYHPPRHRVGKSDIGFARPQDPIATVTSLLSQAWLEGNDIGTHFNGHFCGPTGIDQWTTADWTSEIQQFNHFVDHWRSFGNFGSSAQPTAYDHTVVVGGRTPCLEGKKQAYLTAMKRLGYRYDTSATGVLEWPRRTLGGLWEFPLQTIHWAGARGGSVLAMDYNLWAHYNGAQPIVTDAQRQSVSNAVYNSYLGAFRQTYDGNRAPLFFGNHMNYWGCAKRFTACDHHGHLSGPTNLQHFGPFVDGLQRAYLTMCVQPDVRCVSYRDVADWLDAQTPATLASLWRLAPA